ncbi:MAG: murein biosynthesis integral membrane protein MurJ [Firmicutes bacterium]|nr:murein biosynthesis integral membrane protein MurJ [Bacillota bacterium]
MKEKSAGKKMLLTAVFMAGATLAAKVLALVRDALIASSFGTGMEADAFMAASKLPTTLFDMVIGGVISATFIPVFSQVMQKKNKDEAMKFANKFVTMIFLITVIISVLGIALASPLTDFIAPGYTAEKHALTVQLMSIMFPMIIFTGFAFSFVGILQSFGEYNIPSIISVVYNIAIILYCAVFSNRFGIQGLAVTMLVAWSLQVAVQIPSLVKFKYKFRLDFRLKDENIKKALLLAGPMLISTWVQPLYTIINSRLASSIDGAYSSLEYANRLYLIATGVVSFVVTNLIFPKMSQANAKDDHAEAIKLVNISLKSMMIVIFPLMAGIIVLSTPITTVIYMRGEFTPDKVPVVASALSCYAVGMFGLSINEVLSKTFFSMQNSKTPMINSIISMLFNIAAAYILFNTVGVSGLALAAALGSIVNALLNGICLKRKVPDAFSISDLDTFWKTFVSAAVMGIAVWLLHRGISGYFSGFTGNVIICVICAAAGVLIYAAMVYVLKVKEIRALLKRG